MKSIRFLILISIALFIATSAHADKVYSSGSGITAKTYKERGYISRIVEPFFQYIASLGMVTDVSSVVVYGENPAVSEETEDIWGGGGSLTYAADASADAVSIASSSGSDIYDVIVRGLDISGDAVTQTITLTGTTRAALTTGLWRVQEIENDSTTDLVGNVIIYAGVSTIPSLGDSLIRGVMLAANEKSKMGMITIPNDMVGMLVRHQTGINGWTAGDATGDINSILYIKKYGKPFKYFNFANLVFPYGQVYQNDMNVPIIIPGLSDVRYTADDATEDAVSVFGSFEIIIFPEDGLEDAFLSTIDQPGF